MPTILFLFGAVGQYKDERIKAWNEYFDEDIHISSFFESVEPDM